MATYAVGDIHGRSDLLRDLLSRISPAKRDHVVFLGDYIDRGPDSKGVIDLLLAFRDSTVAQVSFLLGNHEEWLLRTMRDYTRHSWILGMQGLATIRSYSPSAADVLQASMASLGPALFVEKLKLPYDQFFATMPAEHIRFFEDLKLFVQTEDVICVHAGVSESFHAVETESQTTLLWGEPGWWSNYNGPQRVVYGHWGNAISDENRTRPFVMGQTFGIDCAICSRLMAIRFPDEKTWHVQ